MTPTTDTYDALIAATVRPTDDVTLSTGGTIPLRGVSVVEFIQVLRAYPNLREVLLGMIGSADEIADMGVAADLIAAFIDEGPEAISLIVAIATGTPKPGRDAVRDVILQLGDDDFIALLTRTIDLTMPKGVGDFFARFEAVARSLGLVPAPSSEAA